jgi:hypothetical protein
LAIEGAYFRFANRTSGGDNVGQPVGIDIGRTYSDTAAEI